MTQTINTTRINVDSSARNIFPIINIDQSSESNLENDPLVYETEPLNIGMASTEQNIIKIFYPNHNIQKNDLITLTGIERKKITMKTIFYSNNVLQYSVIFTNGSTAVIFKCDRFDPNFNLGDTPILHTTLAKYDTSDVTVSLDGFGMSDMSNYIGNIESNFLNSTHQMYFTNPDPNESDTIINIPVNGYVDAINGFYIKLDKPYVGTQPTTNYTISLTFNHIGGYSISQLNTTENIIGYHKVHSVGPDYIIIAINKKTYYTSNDGKYIFFGGDSVSVSKLISITHGFQSPNNFKFGLPKSIENVVSIKLVNMCFEGSNYSCGSKININSKNNKLYWQTIDNVEIKNITIPNGIYAIKDLASIIMKLMNEKIETNYFTVTVDENIGEIEFKAYTLTKLNAPIIDITPTPNILNVNGLPQDFTITISHGSSDMYKLNPSSVMYSGMRTSEGISGDIINQNHDLVILSDSTYSIICKNITLLISDDFTETYGGNNVYEYFPLKFRLFWNYDDTIGNELGFRNVGACYDTSITMFSPTHTNYDGYENETVITDEIGIKYVYNTNGQKMVLKNKPFKSNAKYALLVIKNLSNNISVYKGHIHEYFSKVFLYVTDTDQNEITNHYNEPININDIEVSLILPNGKLLCTHDEYSFELEISYIVNVAENTNRVSKF